MENITDNLIFIERGYLNANHLVYKAENPILIDSGHGLGIERTLQLVEQTGADISKVERILCTHSHADHIGANKVIQEKSNCDIALHKYGKYFIDQKDGFFLGWSYDNASAFDCNQALEDGQVLQVGELSFQVLHTPGHAFDGVCFYEPDLKILISGDALWESDIPSVYFFKQGGAALFETEASLDKLAKLDVKKVYPGHGKSFEDFEGAIARSRAKLDTYFKDNTKVGHDFFKKVLIYTLMSLDEIEEEKFFPYLMKTDWFMNIVELNFHSEYKKKYTEVVNKFIERGIIIRKDGKLMATVNKG